MHGKPSKCGNFFEAPKAMSFFILEVVSPSWLGLVSCLDLRLESFAMSTLRHGKCAPVLVIFQWTVHWNHVCLHGCTELHNAEHSLYNLLCNFPGMLQSGLIPYDGTLGTLCQFHSCFKQPFLLGDNFSLIESHKKGFILKFIHIDVARISFGILSRCCKILLVRKALSCNGMAYAETTILNYAWY